MARELTGIGLLLILRRLDEDELQLPARELVAIYDQALCEDCGRHHDTVWEAFACDDLSDARARRNAGRRIRLNDRAARHDELQEAFADA